MAAITNSHYYRSKTTGECGIFQQFFLFNLFHIPLILYRCGISHVYI